MALHVMMAHKFQTPEMVLSDEQAEIMGKAATNCLNHVDLLASVQVSPVTKSFIDFALAAGLIYSQIGVQVYIRKKAEADAGRDMTTVVQNG